jgi:hypothetical protein
MKMRAHGKFKFLRGGKLGRKRRKKKENNREVLKFREKLKINSLFEKLLHF